MSKRFVHRCPYGTREMKRYCMVKEDADKLMRTAINKLGLGSRVYSRVLKVGGTIAHLVEAENAPQVRSKTAAYMRF